MEFVFRPTGCMRFGLAAFLGVWLCGWAAGEWFALRVLIAGVQSGQAWTVTSHPAGLMVGGFLILWTTLWTIGGVAALISFLRSVAGVDRLIVTPEAWELERGIGPFSISRTF